MRCAARRTGGGRTGERRPAQCRSRRADLFVGGADDAVAAVRPLLSSYGDPILHVGPLGAGQKVKLVNNALFAAQIGLLSDAVELAARLGVTESALLTALPHGSAASRVLDIVAAGGSVASFIETGRRIRGQGHRGGPANRR